jgi:hypothetical protein
MKTKEKAEIQSWGESGSSVIWRNFGEILVCHKTGGVILIFNYKNQQQWAHSNKYNPAVLLTDRNKHFSQPPPPPGQYGGVGGGIWA